MIQGSQITALLKMVGEKSDRPGEWWLQRHCFHWFTHKKAKAGWGLSKTFADLQRLFLHLNALPSLLCLRFVFLNSTLILDDASLKKWFCQQHWQSYIHMHTRAYRSQTAHCALWPSMGRVGLGSSGNWEDQPSPLSHNEGLITGPASLKSHGSRLPVSVLRSPNILIALLFSLRFYCASLPDLLLLSPHPFSHIKARC